METDGQKDGHQGGQKDDHKNGRPTVLLGFKRRTTGFEEKQQSIHCVFSFSLCLLSLSVCLSLSVSLCLAHSLSLCVSLTLCLSLRVSHSVSPFLPLPPLLYASISGVSPPLFAGFILSLSVFVSLNMPAYVSSPAFCHSMLVSSLSSFAAERNVERQLHSIPQRSIHQSISVVACVFYV